MAICLGLCLDTKEICKGSIEPTETPLCLAFSKGKSGAMVN